MSNNSPARRWFKSSRSSTQSECVEVSFGESEVGVRDSKHPGGPELWFTGEQWDSFVASEVWKA
ncbi:DUF397 domain-containing protein [Nocardia sp. NPDC003693]